MSRYNPHRDIAPLLEAAEQWRDRCLLGDGSLFVDGDRYWTPAYLDELDRAFIRNVLDGSQTFLEKLELQLADCSAGAVRLMAEMLWVLLLFPNNIKWQTKAGQVKRIWDLAGEPLDASHALLTDAVLCGAGSPGMGYNSHRWREMAYLINLASAFKKLSTEDRRHTLADGWRFAQWLETVPREGYRQFRHLLRYLLFPDLFERISVTHDKHDILKGLAGYSPAKLKQLGDMDNDARRAAPPGPADPEPHGAALRARGPAGQAVSGGAVPECAIRSANRHQPAVQHEPAVRTLRGETAQTADRGPGLAAGRAGTAPLSGIRPGRQELAVDAPGYRRSRSPGAGAADTGHQMEGAGCTESAPGLGVRRRSLSDGEPDAVPLQSRRNRPCPRARVLPAGSMGGGFGGSRKADCCAESALRATGYRLDAVSRMQPKWWAL